MEVQQIQAFETKFELPFAAVIATSKMNGISADDGIKHFINPSTLDVYSFEDFDEAWLPKNAHQQEVLENVDYQKYFDIHHIDNNKEPRTTFEKKFHFPFFELVNTQMIQDMERNDGLSHYVDPYTFDVYTFEQTTQTWKEKNEYRQVLQQIRYKQYFAKHCI